MSPSERAAALASASEVCAREPIHIPGSIQPHGFLLVFEASDLKVIQASENVADLLGVEVAGVLGRHFDELLEDAERLRGKLDSLASEDRNPFHLADVTFRVGDPGSAFALMVHRHDGVLITEFEAVDNGTAAYPDLYPLVRTFVTRLQETPTVELLCQLAVTEVKRMTGFGRVNAYRFDALGNGVVIAEDADPDYPRYLGLHFPASDIPQQARALYRANRIRVIGDADYRPSPILPPLNPVSGQPLDLSYAALRSVSPVHVQYMKNMGTRASMSISIVVDGALWGLISCHDAAPQRVGFQTRTACEMLGRILSLQIEAKETHANADRRLKLREHIVQMLSLMADRERGSVAEGLLAAPDLLLGFARASGAAIVLANRCELIGETPPREAVEALVRLLAEREVGEEFHTHNVGRDIAELTELSRYAGGLLAVSLSELHSHYLIWFRPELVRTVNWAGKPEKHLGQGGALNPRHSFESWQETVFGQSAGWDQLEVDSALELRNAVLGIVLRKAEELAQLAGELKKSNRELEAFSYSVSHDLRAPLRHIAGYAELLGEVEGGRLTDSGMRFLSNISDSARFAGTLVDNLLSFSQMGRAALHLSDVNLPALVDSIRQEMLPDYQERTVEWHIQPLPILIADAAFIHLALRNLLSNAIKYSRTRDVAVIEVGAEEHPDEHWVYVRDNGVGFDMEYASKLFGVFQRMHRMEEFEGTGIGLASVRRIIERHDGRVWADSRPDQGATFYFALPKRIHARVSR
ncbi:ATP-binding protein [Pseudomonas kuykendallii]|uniref:ATP-binding protein n=1 Tax=Pseudomonas kuykendallii TaxID=1007099 RepID=UPI0028CFF799|nr:ATP-binding protein [Pseudomonas kuykendallii]